MIELSLMDKHDGGNKGVGNRRERWLAPRNVGEASAKFTLA